MFTKISIVLITLAVLIWQYKRQQRFNRLLLYILHSHPDREWIINHLYYRDALHLKKDLRKMIHADINLSELEKALKEHKPN